MVVQARRGELYVEEAGSDLKLVAGLRPRFSRADRHHTGVTADRQPGNGERGAATSVGSRLVHPL